MNKVQRYIINEIFPIFIMGNFLFMFLLLIERLVTLADLFFAKNVPLSIILETILYFMPSLFVMTIPLAGLLSVLIGFSRLSADSELIAMRSSGAGKFDLIKPVLVFGVLAFFLSLLMSGYLVEKGSKLALNNLNKIIENISISDLRENEMYENLPGILIFVKHKIDDKNFDGIIVVNKADGSIITASNGSISPTEKKTMEMKFRDGRLIVTAKNEETTSISFKELLFNMPMNLNIASAVDSPMTMNLYDLFKSAPKNPKAAFELSKRFSLPFSSIIMCLFGFSLGVFLSRSGKSFGVLISIGVAFLYNFLMIYLENSAGTFPISPYIAAWLPNILFSLLLIFFLRRSLR